MKTLLTTVVIFFLASTVYLASDALACASFSFKTGDSLIFGRNVDSPAGSGSDVTGLVVVNKRGVYKEGASFEALYGGKKDPPPVFSWVSKYGSITFNFSSTEFPDGGMNEAGLFFEEMTLLDTKYPTEKDNPTLFMVLWIQYVLDTCGTVADVVKSATQMNLDGWNWHFYAADKSGDSAVIEFLDGKPVIYRGKTLPHPILTNSTYASEIEKLKRYQGFGGEEPLDVRDFDGPTRFIRGAAMIHGGVPSGDMSPVKYGFEILDTISPNHMKKMNKNNIVTTLAKVYDVKNGRIYFRTNSAKQIRYVEMDAFDYSCQSPSMILDLHKDLSGNVTSAFSPYSAKKDMAVLRKSFENFAKNPEFQQYLQGNGINLESVVRRHSEHRRKTRCTLGGKKGQLHKELPKKETKTVKQKRSGCSSTALGPRSSWFSLLGLLLPETTGTLSTLVIDSPLPLNNRKNQGAGSPGSPRKCSEMLEKGKSSCPTPAKAGFRIRN